MIKKNVLQDVVPAKKTIRDIEISRNRESSEVSKKSSKYSMTDSFSRPVSINQSINKPKDQSINDQAPIKIESVNSYKTPPPTPPPSTSPYKYEYPRPKKSKKILYGGIVFLVLVIAFGFSAMFKSAEIKITPKQDIKTLNETFIAKKDSATGLAFQVVTVSKEVEKSVDPKDVTSEQKVEKKARGSIVIYNNASTQVQKLVATTRFQTPEGLIFRLVSPAVVPGKTTKDGKTTPGSVEVVVEADKAGVEYNIGLKDFTVPGLKSDPVKYKEIYAKSKTEMTGGFSGMQKVITKEVLTKTEEEMDNNLRDLLSKDIITQMPGDYVLYKKSMSFKFDPVVISTNSNGTVVLKKKAVTSAIIFNRSILTKTILDKVFPDAGDNVIKITNLDSLDFSYSDPGFQINGSTSITFLLKGDANLEWIFDENSLKNDLLGLSKKSANTVMTSYPSIKEAWITTRPFWNSTIPKDSNKVTVINTESE